MFSDAALHAFSQLVYLDAVPGMVQDGVITVGGLASFYLDTGVGRAYLSARFSASPREYALWPPFLDMCRAAYGAWRIVDILDDNGSEQSGLYACAYQAETGGRAVAFRGSEVLGNRRYRNDYWNDFALSYDLVTPQQAVADAYWRRYGGGGEEVYITGHSLGGNLAAYAAISAPDAIQKRLRRCVCLNAPGFNDDFLGARQADIDAVADRIVLYQNEYDIVSSLLYAPVEARVVHSRFDPLSAGRIAPADILYPHSNFMFQTDRDGRFVAVPGNQKSALCGAVQEISARFLRLPVFARKAIAALLLDVLYRNPTKENAHRDMLQAALGFLARNEESHSAAEPELAELEKQLSIAAVQADLIALPELYRHVRGGGCTGDCALAWCIGILAGLPGGVGVGTPGMA